jgi:hypothetical protein
MTVIDQTTNKEWDFYNFPRGGVSGGGTLVTGGHPCWVDNIVSGKGLTPTPRLRILTTSPE